MQNPNSKKKSSDKKISKSKNSKEARLDELKAQMLSNLVLGTNMGKTLVFGNGNPNAKIFFSYEAPSEIESKSGVAMDGESGKLFYKLLKECGLSKDDIYVTPIMKYGVNATDGNPRPPTQAEMEYCRPFIEKQIDIIRPNIVIALGMTAFYGFWGQPLKNTSMKDIRGEIFPLGNFDIMITYHISFLLHYGNKNHIEQFLGDIKEAIKSYGVRNSKDKK